MVHDSMIHKVPDGLLPDAATLALLQAILSQDVANAKAAFLRWQGLMPFDDMPYSHLALMGELANVIEVIDPNYPHRARMMGLKKYVWSNNIRILHPVLSVLDACAQEGIIPVLIKGGGVIAADSTQIHRRFIRDLDLLVPESQIVSVSKVMINEGWRPTSGRIPGAIRAQSFDREMVDQQGSHYRVEIDLHRSVLHLGRHSDADCSFFSRTLNAQLFGRPVQTLHHQDWALVSLMHGGVYSESPNFAWLIDAVRAMRLPEFSADNFLKTLAERSLITAATPLLKYLEQHFELGFPSYSHHQSLMKNLLFSKEAQAIGHSRKERGMWGRVFMWLAEFVRSKKITHRVSYATDLGVYARRSYTFLFASPTESQLNFRLNEDKHTRRLDIEIHIPINDSAQSDYDLWFEGRWVTRIKIRSRLTLLGIKRKGVWRAQVPIDFLSNLTGFVLKKIG